MFFLNYLQNVIFVTILIILVLPFPSLPLFNILHSRFLFSFIPHFLLSTQLSISMYRFIFHACFCYFSLFVLIIHVPLILLLAVLQNSCHAPHFIRRGNSENTSISIKKSLTCTYLIARKRKLHAN